jgi:CheY-like chemotaxis protein
MMLVMNHLVERKKILIIDDNQDVLSLLTSLFEIEGYEVIAFTNTTNIIELTTANNPDLVILDYLIGESNGGELCAQLKHNKLTKHLPVIILSAFNRVIQSLGNYGCDVFIPKPFDNQLLIDEVKGLLYKKQTI